MPPTASQSAAKPPPSAGKVPAVSARQLQALKDAPPLTKAEELRRKYGDTAVRLAQIEAKKRALEPPARKKQAEARSLAAFVESTTQGIVLERWQQAICERLQALPEQKGQRLLLHAPPQFGKSLIVSQRFPAWVMGAHPNHRIRLACYNETHAEEFSKVNLLLMQDDAFKQWFPDQSSRVSGRQAAIRWSTDERLKYRDGQPSFVALGLGSGFTGLGAEIVIIDDPYKNADEAFSEAVGKSIWQWWTQVVAPRLNPATNVVVMFHRWKADDLAGKLLEQGGWELLRYPAIADGEAGDATGLPIGSPLSPRFSLAHLERVKAGTGTLEFAALFQGMPGDASGNLIRSEYFRSYWRDGEFYCLQRGERVERVRASDVWRFTTVDWASSDAKTADWTVATTWGVTPRNDLLTLNVKRGREEGPEAKGLVRGELQVWEPAFVVVEKNGLGLPMTQDLQREGWPIRGVWQHTKKEVRAQSLAVAYENGRVFHPREADWLHDWTKELLAFPAGANDDQLDTGSLAAKAVVTSNAVIRDFSPSLHVSLDSLPYEARNGFVVGWAVEPVPACVIGQVQGAQLLLYVGEVAASGEGLETFILRVAGMLAKAGGKPVQQLTLRHFASRKVLDDGLGPVFYAAGLQGDSRPQFALGKVVEEQPNRDEAIRRRCKSFHEGRPDLLISPNAEELQSALSVGYVYRTDQQGMPQPKTEPNSAMALCEALGCLCVGVQGVLAVAPNAVAEHLKRERAKVPATRGMGSRGRR